MALLRSDVLNRELVERIVLKREKRLTARMRTRVVSLTVGELDSADPNVQRFVLRAVVQQEGKPATRKVLAWLAKLPIASPERNIRKLRTEIRFYERLSPCLPSLALQSPVHASLDGDRSVLLLEDVLSESRRRFRPSPVGRDLDLDEVTQCVKWLAKFHAETAKLIKSHPEWIKENEDWLK